MTSSKMEHNIYNKLLSDHQATCIQLVGFDWDGSVGHSRWFAFCSNGDTCWHVQFDGTDLRIDIAKRDDWNYISPHNSHGFINQDFRGCNLNGFDLSYSIFKRCKFDVGSVDDNIQTKTEFIDCTYHEGVSVDWQKAVLSGFFSQDEIDTRATKCQLAAWNIYRSERGRWNCEETKNKFINSGVDVAEWNKIVVEIDTRWLGIIENQKYNPNTDTEKKKKIWSAMVQVVDDRRVSRFAVIPTLY